MHSGMANSVNPDPTAILSEPLVSEILGQLPFSETLLVNQTYSKF